MFQKAKWKISRSLKTKEISDPVCVDLAVLRPCYAATIANSKSVDQAYLWQEWKCSDETVDIELLNSDAAYFHPDTTTISFADVFFCKDNTHIDRAARAFASKLREGFKNDTLIWLVPDWINDFELEAGRRNLNARFSNAEPLPRSVAAVFERVDYSRITGNDFSVVVVDTIGGQTCVTKLIAKLDRELKKRLPETKGYFWEHCPPVIISSKAPESTEQKIDLITVDSKGQWHDAVPFEKPPFFDSTALKNDPRIGEFNFCITLTESPVIGGIRLHVLQQRAGDIPLWCDNIPELSIKVMRDGRYQRFHLVSRGTTVKTLRGQAALIPVEESFTLPAGKHFYEFPLFQGENAEDLGFSARLGSPAFPLKTDTKCKLNLTFEYGADEPYKLIFEPHDKSFPPVRATWRRTEEVIVTDAPSPQYPEPLLWENLRRWIDAQGNTVDLLEWLVDSLARLNPIA